MEAKEILGMIYKFKEKLNKMSDEAAKSFDIFKNIGEMGKMSEAGAREETINEIIDELNDVLDAIEKDMKEEEEVAEVLSIKITDAEKEEKLIEFSKELEHLINKYSIDSMANMPDYKITEMVIEKIKYLI